MSNMQSAFSTNSANGNAQRSFAFEANVQVVQQQCSTNIFSYLAFVKCTNLHSGLAYELLDNSCQQNHCLRDWGRDNCLLSKVDVQRHTKQLNSKNITTSSELAGHLLNHHHAIHECVDVYKANDHLSVRIAPVDFEGRNLIRHSFSNQQLSAPENCNQQYANMPSSLKGQETFLDNLKL